MVLDKSSVDVCTSNKSAAWNCATLLLKDCTWNRRSFTCWEEGASLELSPKLATPLVATSRFLCIADSDLGEAEASPTAGTCPPMPLTPCRDSVAPSLPWPNEIIAKPLANQSAPG